MKPTQEQLRQELARLFGRVKDPHELEVLIDGLFTPPELEDFIFRWRLMTRLLAGQTQREISKELGVSLGKIARGSRLIKYGPSEFRDLVERFERQDKEGQA